MSGVSSLLIMLVSFLKRGSPQPPPLPSAMSAPPGVRARWFSLPRSTMSRCPKPPLTGSRKLTKSARQLRRVRDAGNGRGACNTAASRAAVLRLDAAKVDAPDPGTPRSPLRAFASSEQTAPIHPHPTPQSPARHPTSEHCGPSPTQYRVMPVQCNDGGETHMAFVERAVLGSARDGHQLTRSPPSPPASAQVHAVPHVPRPHQHVLCLLLLGRPCAAASFRGL
ncbi:hypothetical protein DFH09DRAFT_1189172 [Mycena vulgaris]|nr:hypothetical protein DFH09DRAFT_1189172 [Mycena vulgaris]